MTRPLPIAASLALAALSLAVYAQTPPATAPVAQPAPVETATAMPAPADAGAPAAATAPTTVASAPAAAAVPTGSAARGKQLAYTCQGCHGITGYKNAYPNYHVPRIGGQTPEYLSSALHGYRKGARKHPTMQAQAESFSEQDIADIATYLSSLTQ
ncbi:MAG: c-type cytochrome [Luteimonas sp.]